MPAYLNKSKLVFFYNIFIQLYLLGIKVAALRNKKAKEWIRGRKNWQEELKQKINPADKIIWMHCASAGEFEQGKPLIEEIKQIYPDHKVVVSFFSPSGYNAGKKYVHADFITYLPADTRSNAKRFIELVKPELVIFVKYEYWYHHLSVAAFHHIPVLIVSAIFRKEQLFFKWYGKFYRQMLFLFRQIFVQDEVSLKILKENAVNHCVVSNDTRFDRVKKIAESFSEIELIKEWINNDPVIVAGSTWPEDENILAKYLKNNSVKLIVAPHEINESHLKQIERLFPGAIRYSALRSSSASQVVIMDNTGMLSRLYHYATITYIGGGFNKSGIHNTLEAAVHGKPVLFGPNYQKFREARELMETGGGFSISTTEEFKMKTDHLLNDPQLLLKTSTAAKNYVEKNVGATPKILHYIQVNRLLTRL